VEEVELLLVRPKDCYELCSYKDAHRGIPKSAELTAACLPWRSSGFQLTCTFVAILCREYSIEGNHQSSNKGNVLFKEDFTHSIPTTPRRDKNRT
jgi:hypothetical protein